MGDLRYKQRKASLVYNCLALERRPHYVQFEMNSVLEIDTETDLRAMGGIVKVIFTTIRTMGLYREDLLILISWNLFSRKVTCPPVFNHLYLPSWHTVQSYETFRRSQPRP